jgi:hypothetical protein
MAAPVLFVRVVIVLCRVTYDTYCPTVIHSAIHFRVAKLLRRDPARASFVSSLAALGRAPMRLCTSPSPSIKHRF